MANFPADPRHHIALVLVADAMRQLDIIADVVPTLAARDEMIARDRKRMREDQRRVQSFGT